MLGKKFWRKWRKRISNFANLRFRISVLFLLMSGLFLEDVGKSTGSSSLHNAGFAATSVLFTLFFWFQMYLNLFCQVMRTCLSLFPPQSYISHPDLRKTSRLIRFCEQVGFLRFGQVFEVQGESVVGGGAVNFTKEERDQNFSFNLKSLSLSG